MSKSQSIDSEYAASMNLHQLKANVDSPTWRRLTGALGLFADEYTLEFGPETIDAYVHNRTDTVACSVSIPVEYDTDFEPLTVGFEHDRLSSASSFFDLAGTLDIRFTDGEDRASFSQTDPSLNNAGYGDDARLVDPESIHSPERVGDFETPTTIELDAQDFKAAVGAVAMPNDQLVRVVATSGGLRTEGRAFGDEPCTWTVDADVSGPLVSRPLSSSYLTAVASALPPTGRVTIETGPESMVRIETEHLEFVVAPRLEDE